MQIWRQKVVSFILNFEIIRTREKYTLKSKSMHTANYKKERKPNKWTYILFQQLLNNILHQYISNIDT